MTKQKVVEVSNLDVTFQNRQVLSDVNFAAYQGEVTIILGASGSGKTTVLKHILGLFPVEKGNINILGQDFAQLNEEEQQQLYLKMGVFYQNGALLNSLTVAENVALPLQQHTTLPPYIIEQLVRTKLNLVNLDDAFHLYPSQLSGGMLKRAALTRAIIMDPHILFCDEPGAGLDPVSLAELDELLLNLKQQLGMSIIMVTHEVASIKRIANRIIFIENGTVIFEGSLEEARNSGKKALQEFFMDRQSA